MGLWWIGWTIFTVVISGAGVAATQLLVPRHRRPGPDDPGVIACQVLHRRAGAVSTAVRVNAGADLRPAIAELHQAVDDVTGIAPLLLTRDIAQAAAAVLEQAQRWQQARAGEHADPVAAQTAAAAYSQRRAELLHVCRAWSGLDRPPPRWRTRPMPSGPRAGAA